MSDILEFNGQHRWLSNFYPCIVEYEGIAYPTTENAYQAAKTLNEYTRINISKMSPFGAKRMGKILELRHNWRDISIGIMKELLVQKFNQPVFKKLLKDTGDCLIVEGNTWGDTFWGVCNGVGENRLGFLIMEIRKDLQ